jgi:hypothetical protein
MNIHMMILYRIMFTLTKFALENSNKNKCALTYNIFPHVLHTFKFQERKIAKLISE